MGIAATQLQFNEFCPKCGEGVARLNSLTGFCLECSPFVAGETRLDCEICGKEFTTYQNSRTTCLPCRNIQWLVRNADALERVMVHDNNVNVVKAIIKVHDDNRPRCAMCGDKIKHGTNGRTMFCSKRDGCRRAAIRYRIYRKRNMLLDEEALERAVHGRSGGNRKQPTSSNSSN